MNKLFTLLISICCTVYAVASDVVWKIGEANHSASDLALGPSGYKQFLAHDFGYEDRYFLIGKSSATEDFPYVLPGPDDTWGGTWNTSGWRTHEVNVLFGVHQLPKQGLCKLVVKLVDANTHRSVVKLMVNGVEKKFEIKGHSDDVLDGNVRNAVSQILELPVSVSDLKRGGNVVNISVLEGGWIVFDQVCFEGTRGIVLADVDSRAFIRDVSSAKYEILHDGVRVQPLLVDVEHLSGNGLLTVRLDGKEIFCSHLDTARYVFEAPMAAVWKKKKSQYEVLVDGHRIERGTIERSPQKVYTPADYVDTRMGTAHSRWMIAPGPWMPFSMVKLSPDNQNMGWQSGYQPTFETIGCFSHIHEWTMG